MDTNSKKNILSAMYADGRIRTKNKELLENLVEKSKKNTWLSSKETVQVVSCILGMLFDERTLQRQIGFVK